jgi:Zn-dependent protease with chaperone function
MVAKFIDLGYERIEYVVNMADNIRVGPRQLPKIYAMLQESCAVLDTPEPELYVRQGPVNAHAVGHTNPHILLETGLLDVMDDDELMAVIAHEVGHIKCGHVLYKEMARSIQIIAQQVGDRTFGLGELFLSPVKVALGVWDRRSELSADRAALLVMQDARPCLSMLMKVGGGSVRIAHELDLDAFVQQANSYLDDAERTLGDRLYKLLVSVNRSHPFAVQRAKELLEWTKSTELRQILAGDYSRMDDPMEDRICPDCARPVPLGQKFCGDCGRPMAIR